MPITFVDARDEAAYGGTGGEPFRYPGANPDQALVGLKIWYADVVDAIAPLFARLNTDGTMGPIEEREKSGGPGGSSAVVTFPGHVVVGLYVNWGAVVDSVRLAFRAWTPSGVTGAHSWTDVVGGRGGDQGPGEYVFDLGRCAVAVRGKAGTPSSNIFARLDSIGLSSALPVFPAP